jgi:hypothetical protein
MSDRTSNAIPLETASIISAYMSQAETSTQNSNHDSVISSVSRSESVRYERVLEQEQRETRSEEYTTNISLPDSNSHTAEKPDSGSLRRSPFQWWLLTPMDVLLALTPLFFLSNIVA